MKVSVSNLLMYRPERDNDALPENAGSNVKSVKFDGQADLNYLKKPCILSRFPAVIIISSTNQ
jgi:hypothetical protein